MELVVPLEKPPAPAPDDPIPKPLSSDCCQWCNFVANLEDAALPTAERLLVRSHDCKGHPRRGFRLQLSPFHTEPVG